MFKPFKQQEFKTIFLNENNFIGQDERFTMIKIFSTGEYIWVKNSMVKYQELSKKTNKLYNSVTLKLDWDYNVFLNKEQVATLKGVDIVDRFFQELKK